MCRVVIGRADIDLRVAIGNGLDYDLIRGVGVLVGISFAYLVRVHVHAEDLCLIVHDPQGQKGLICVAAVVADPGGQIVAIVLNTQVGVCGNHDEAHHSRIIAAFVIQHL